LQVWVNHAGDPLPPHRHANRPNMTPRVAAIFAFPA
jgi:hypothetical protein